MRIVSLSHAPHLPKWRQPIVLLVFMAIAMPVAFNTWSALLNNFVVEKANFDGSDVGFLHSLLEIPGFLSVGFFFLLFFIR